MIEIIAQSVSDAQIIEDCGADRIELVKNLMQGGLTPDFNIIEKVVESVNIPVNVMIRPHSKDFVYSTQEINNMKNTIQIVKSLGVNGVVFGMLDRHKDVDFKALEDLLSVCKGLDVTFHRAIDEAKNLEHAAKLISSYSNITTILTSGGKGDIVDNIDKINAMVKISNNVDILIGGGLKFNNIEYINKNVNTKNFHFGTAVRYDSKSSSGVNPMLMKKLVKKLKSKL